MHSDKLMVAFLSILTVGLQAKLDAADAAAEIFGDHGGGGAHQQYPNNYAYQAGRMHRDYLDGLRGTWEERAAEAEEQAHFSRIHQRALRGTFGEQLQDHVLQAGANFTAHVGIMNVFAAANSLWAGLRTVVRDAYLAKFKPDVFQAEKATLIMQQKLAHEEIQRRKVMGIMQFKMLQNALRDSELAITAKEEKLVERGFVLYDKTKGVISSDDPHKLQALKRMENQLASAASFHVGEIHSLVVPPPRIAHGPAAAGPGQQGPVLVQDKDGKLVLVPRALLEQRPPAAQPEQSAPQEAAAAA